MQSGNLGKLDDQVINQTLIELIWLIDTSRLVGEIQTTPIVAGHAQRQPRPGLATQRCVGEIYQEK